MKTQFEQTKKNKERAAKAFSMELDWAIKNCKYVKVRYLDDKVKKLGVYHWDLLRSGIEVNLYRDHLCTVTPVYNYKYYWRKLITFLCSLKIR